MTNRNFWQLLLLVLLAGLMACQPSTPAGQQVSVTPPGTEASSGVDPATEAARQKILTILESYYGDLSAEQLDASRYYAPIVTTFFNSQNLSREKVGESIRNGFASVENRQITIDPSSLKLSPGSEGYIAEFEGTARFTRSNDKQQLTDAFHNRISFNADFLITSYESQAPGTPAMSARSIGIDPALSEIANRVLSDLKAGTLTNTSYIHPRKGLFLITRPGVYSFAYQHASLADAAAQEAPWLSKGLESLMITARQEELPEFTCDALFSKQGTFIAPFTGRYDGVSSLMQSLSEAEVVPATEENLAAARDIERYVRAQLIDTAEGLSLYFGLIDGVWYLLVMDLASYDCSA